MIKKPSLVCLLLIAFFLGIGFSNLITAQSREIDSIKTLIKSSTSDTAKVRLNLEIASVLYNDAPDSALLYCKMALDIAEKSNHSPSLMDAWSWNAVLYQRKNELNRALYFYEKSLKLMNKTGEYKDLSTVLNNIAQIYTETGEIKKALEYYEKGLRMFEQKLKTDDDKKLRLSVAEMILNVASIYKKQGEWLIAMEHYNKSLKMFQELQHIMGVANCYNNIAMIHMNNGEYKKALELFLQSLEINEKLGNKLGTARAYNNISTIYSNYGDPEITSSLEASRKAGYSIALKYLEKSMALQLDVKDYKGLTNTFHNMSAIYYNSNHLNKSLEFALKAMEVAQQLKYPENIRNGAHSLYKIYKAKNNFKLAVENYELYIKMRDSINNESTRKMAIKTQLKYEYEKQAAADSVSHAKESEIKNAEIAKQTAEIKAKKNQQYALFGGLGLVMIFAGFMFNRFKVTHRQKTIIESQKEIVEEQKLLVEEKQKEILDSIQYARRIQMAQMSSEKQIIKTIERLKVF